MILTLAMLLSLLPNNYVGPIGFSAVMSETVTSVVVFPKDDLIAEALNSGASDSVAKLYRPVYPQAMVGAENSPDDILMSVFKMLIFRSVIDVCIGWDDPLKFIIKPLQRGRIWGQAGFNPELRSNLNKLECATSGISKRNRLLDYSPSAVGYKVDTDVSNEWLRLLAENCGIGVFASSLQDQPIFDIRCDGAPSCCGSIFLRNLQGFFSLPQRTNYKDNTEEGQCRPDSRNDIPPPCGFRSFFRSNGGAPLSAQISAIVIFTTVTGLGIFVGVGGVIRRRRTGWLYLFGGLCVYGLLLWWSSPA